jgi:hypothetical protein
MVSDQGGRLRNNAALSYTAPNSAVVTTQQPLQFPTMSETSALLDIAILSPADHPDHPYSSWPSLPPNPIGRLALLTPAITAAAARSSLLTGQRFSLDFSAYPSGASMHGRFEATHEVKRIDTRPHTLEEAKAQGVMYEPEFDCFVTLNTQGSTQWDYFLHYSYRYSGLFYGGLTADQVNSQNTGDFGVAGEWTFGGRELEGSC